MVYPLVPIEVTIGLNPCTTIPGIANFGQKRIPASEEFESTPDAKERSPWAALKKNDAFY